MTSFFDTLESQLADDQKYFEDLDDYSSYRALQDAIYYAVNLRALNPDGGKYFQQVITYFQFRAGENLKPGCHKGWFEAGETAKRNRTEYYATLAAEQEKVELVAYRQQASNVLKAIEEAQRLAEELDEALERVNQSLAVTHDAGGLERNVKSMRDSIQLTKVLLEQGVDSWYGYGQPGSER